MPKWCGESGGAGAAGLDKGADAEAEVGNGEPGGDGLGVNGKRAFSRAVEGGREFEEGARGTKKGEESHQQGGVHHVFAQVFLLAKKSQNQKDGAQIGRDEGGFVDGSRQEKGPEAHGDVEKGKDESDLWHAKA